MSYIRRLQPSWGIPHGPGAASRSDRPRKLAIESLESRYALSVAAASLDPCPVVAEEETIVELPLATAETIEKGSADTLEPEFVGPLEADAYFEAISATQASVTAEAEGENQNEPPVLLSFFAVDVGAFWILAGRVTDDFTPSNCRVFFDGILEGQSTGVLPDGSFMYLVPFSPGMNELINAVAKDMDNAVSNSMSVMLIA